MQIQSSGTEDIKNGLDRISIGNKRIKQLEKWGEKKEKVRWDVVVHWEDKGRR